MKSIIETELPGSTGELLESGAESKVEKVTTLDLSHCAIDLCMTGLELEKKVLKTYSRLLKAEKPFICSLSELIQSIHYIDLALYWSYQETTVSLNYFCNEELLDKNYTQYRKVIYKAIENAQYIDSVFISDNELNDLKTPSKYVLQNAYVDCDFSFSAFEKAFKFNKKLNK